MKTLLVMNPTSRSGRGKRLWSQWQRGLQKRGLGFECVETEHPGHARDLARSAAADTTVVAVGGDGTINEVLDGVARSTHASVRMAVLYSGTSPDFCRFHAIPVTPDAALDALAAGVSTRIDIARIALRDTEGQVYTAHFGCGCNIGLGASVARGANRYRRFLGDTAGTALALLRAVAASRPSDLKVAVDGVARELSCTRNLSVLKSPHMASGLKVNADLTPDDGRLLLLGIHNLGLPGVLRTLPGFYSGNVIKANDVFLAYGSRISVRTVQSGQPVEVELDGDPRGFLPADIELLPRAIQLVGGAR